MSALISGTGRVANDPVLRQVLGTDVLNFRFAMENGWGDRKKTEFVDCALWGRRAVSMSNVLQRGTYISLFGAEFSIRGYEHNGERRVSLELRIDQFDLGPRSAAAGHDRRAADAGPIHSSGPQASDGSAAVTDFDDEIPF